MNISSLKELDESINDLKHVMDIGTHIEECGCRFNNFTYDGIEKELSITAVPLKGCNVGEMVEDIDLFEDWLLISREVTADLSSCWTIELTLRRVSRP
jgi:hypothetical protein